VRKIRQTIDAIDENILLESFHNGMNALAEVVRFLSAAGLPWRAAWAMVIGYFITRTGS